MSNTFSWKTTFKSIIIVDGELFSNEYSVNISLTPHTANLKEQSEQYAKEEISISWQEYFNDIIEERYDKFNDTRYLQFEEIWHLD